MFEAIDGTGRTVFLADTTRYSSLLILSILLSTIIGNSQEANVKLVVDKSNLVLALALRA